MGGIETPPKVGDSGRVWPGGDIADRFEMFVEESRKGWPRPAWMGSGMLLHFRSQCRTFFRTTSFLGQKNTQL